MYKAARIVFTLAMAFVLLSTAIGQVSAAPAPQAKWTVMVYMSGDNNLEDYIVKDIETELAPAAPMPTCRSLRSQTVAPVTIPAMATGKPPNCSM